MSDLAMTKHHDHKRKRNDSGHTGINGAGQRMQTTDRRHRVARWALGMILATLPAWAFAQSDLVMTVTSSATTKINTKGGAISVANTIKNQGPTASTVSVRVGLYLSTDNVITTADTLLGSRTVGVLAAGASNAYAASNVTVPAGLAPGTYYIGAIADDTGLEAESDEGNNGFAGTTLTVTLSDLVMTTVSSTTSVINTKGGAISVANTLKNQAAVASTVSVRVGLYLSTDNVITTADTLLGSRTVGALAAGATSVSSGNSVTVPAGLAPGTYYVGAIADDTGLEVEADEGNNGIAGSTLTVTLSDLVMTAVGSTISVINTNGGLINVSDTIKNQAAVASTIGVRVGYYLSTDNVITADDTFLGYRSAGALVAGGTQTNVGANYATVPAGMVPGDYYLGALADYSGLEVEADEGNNGMAAVSTFTVVLSDLTMTAVGSTTSVINTNGGLINVSDTIKNQAAVASTIGVRVGYYLSTDNVITADDTFLGYRSAGALVAGGTQTNVGANYATVPAGMVPGDYYLGALADYSGLEVEADESNNGVGIPFKVALSDMIMTAVGSTATKAAPGSSINVSDTLKNQGSVTSTVTVRVGYYLSSDNVIAADDTFLGYRSVGALAAGAAQTNVGANYATVPVGTAPGTYYIGAIADYSALEAESDETNNSLVGPTIAIGPDLVMSSFSTTSTAAIPGYVVPITDTLKNQGASATTSGCRTVAYYLSTDDIITATDTLIGSRQHCGALAANGTSVNAASILIIPANTAIGTYYLGAIADSTEAEAEAVETNNSIVVAVPLLVANVPAAPTGVNATGAHTKATVSFNASGNDGGAAITGYTVTSNPAGGVDSNAGSTGLSHVVTGLTNGTSYTFTVKAINAVGSSVASQPSNSITPAPTAPDAPTNATAVGGHTKATVSFTAPAENGAAISGYNVSSSPAGGVDSNAGGTGLSHIVTGLTNGVSYTFTVTAINAMGTSTPSQPSNSIIPAPTAPDAPTHVKAAGGNSQATISFTAPAENGSPISGYTVTSNPGGITASGTGSPIIVTGLTNGTAYTFTVTATNGIGTSDPSQPSNSIIAMVVPQVYYIHADHLSSPRQITDAAGNLVWQWDNSDPFGNNVPNENPNGAGQFNFNLRFPGQYADKETNTYYNVMRDYDPSTGRYIQSDPIGLDGGINTYTYALNDPTYWTDPLGLESISKRQAKRIIDEAATWVDTAYASPGATKNEGADCSGSTWAIYKKAGFPFKRSSTASFENLNVKTGRFVKVDKPQIGDIVLFKKHMAVYDSNAGTTCGCSKRNNLDLWTTHGTNDDPGRYGAGAQRDFPGTPKYYRYNTDDSGIRFPLLEWGII